MADELNTSLNELLVTNFGLSPSGYTGSRGDDGYVGSQGPAGGYTGSRGDTGYVGSTGTTGDQGYTGSQGTGYTGSQGTPGQAAAIGYTGSAGADGAIGYTGSKGFTGFVGSQGLSGAYAAVGYTGSAGTDGIIGVDGYTGSKGDTGLGFRIAKSYVSVAALTADTAPTGIVAGEFALIETGNVQDADNSKLYLWNGSAYSYVNDLSGAAGITGPSGTTGFTGSAGSAGSNGFTGSAGTAGTNGTNGFTGSLGFTGSTGVGFTGSSGFTGSTGVGFTGSSGTQGIIGYTGSAGTGGAGGGDNGYTGSQGIPGTLASGQVTNTFTGTGSNTVFTLTVAPVSIDATIVNIDGVMQQRSTYTVSGYTLTLDQALLVDEVMEVTVATYGATNFVTRTYTGNGTTVNYTVTNGTTVDGVIVTENGVVQTPTTDYTISGNTLTFVTAPVAGTTIGIREIPSGSIGGTAVYSRSSVVATAGQTNFAVAYTVGYLQVYLNGVLLNATDYAATTGATVVLADAAAAGDLLEFVSYNVVPIAQVAVATFNSTNITTNVAITAGYSAVSVGPLAVADGVTISIAAGQKWVIL